MYHIVSWCALYHLKIFLLYLFTGNCGLFQRSMCVVILFAAVFCFFLLIWESDYIQPERILTQYQFKWHTLQTIKYSTFTFKGNIMEKSTTASVLKTTLTPLKNKVEHSSVGTTSNSRTTTISNVKKHVTLATRHPPSHFITLDFQGRLGNLLFQTASLYGIADKNNLAPVTSPSLELYRYFQLTMSKNRKSHLFTKTYREKKGCAFDPGAMKLGENENFKLLGYYQSWKYFKSIEEKIRKEFKFKASVDKIASEQFAALTSKIGISSKGNITYVAIHIRRGDMVKNKVFMDYGYIAADVDYVTRGMQFFKSKFQNVIFIMASDDLSWCKKHFKSEDVKFVKSGNSAAIDMAVLTKCNHSLLTVGSYGWWVGWMINGVTVFYKDYPKKGSKLYSLYVREDYIPPNWIGM